MLLSLRNVVFASFIIFEKLEARLKKSTRKMRMVSRFDHGKIVLKVHKIVPGTGFLSIFLPQSRNFAKNFLPGAGNFTTLKKFPGGQPGEGMLVLGIH